MFLSCVTSAQAGQCPVDVPMRQDKAFHTQPSLLVES